jgi:hypothetical protein
VASTRAAAKLASKDTEAQAAHSVFCCFCSLSSFFSSLRAVGGGAATGIPALAGHSSADGRAVEAVGHPAAVDLAVEAAASAAAAQAQVGNTCEQRNF